MTPPIYRIEICGGIASGKTTLASLLTKLDIKPVLENFESNPFWRDFYADPVGNAFETEVTFLLQHYHETKIAAQKGDRLVCDFSMYLDLAYATVTLPTSKRDAFLAVYHQIKEELGSPTLLVHLKCAPEIELERIRRRGRDVENTITIDYLQQINSNLESILSGHSFPGEPFIIDSGSVDFANDDAGKLYVLETVSQQIWGRSYLK